MFEILKIATITTVVSCLAQQENTILGWYGKLIKKLPFWLYKPLGGCVACMTGQVAMWYYLFTRSFHLLEFGFFVCAAIIMSLFLSVVYQILVYLIDIINDL